MKFSFVQLRFLSIMILHTKCFKWKIYISHIINVSNCGDLTTFQVITFEKSTFPIRTFQLIDGSTSYYSFHYIHISSSLNFQHVTMALEVFSSIRYFLKPEDISIDNWIFKLHYRVSVALMLGSSAIGVAKQYFGDPINCQVSSF